MVEGNGLGTAAKHSSTNNEEEYKAPAKPTKTDVL
jgi:hypothetical protein